MAKSNAISGGKEEVPVERQQARCAFVALALGNALLDLPEDFEATKKDASALDRAIKWHGKISDECSAKKLPKNNAMGVTNKMKHYVRLSNRSGLSKEAADKRRVAVFWACVVLVWDVRVTCPAFGRTSAWRYLDLATEQLGRSLLAAYEGADIDGDNIYLELAW